MSGDDWYGGSKPYPWGKYRVDKSPEPEVFQLKQLNHLPLEI